MYHFNHCRLNALCFFFCTVVNCVLENREYINITRKQVSEEKGSKNLLSKTVDKIPENVCHFVAIN